MFGVENRSLPQKIFWFLLRSIEQYIYSEIPEKIEFISIIKDAY